EAGQRHAERALDDRPLGRLLRRRRDLLPLAAAARPEQRARRRNPIGPRPLDRDQLAPGHLPLFPLDANAPAPARARDAHRVAPPPPCCRPTASPPNASDSTSTLT